MKKILGLLSALALAVIQAAALEAVHHGEVFFGKDERRALVSYKADPGAEGSWLREGAVIGEGEQVTLFYDPARPVTWRNAAGEVFEVPELPPPPGGRRPADLEAGIVFFAPEVIYDDEEREFYWEVSSKLPASGDYTMKVVPDRPSRSFPEQTLRIELGGRRPDDRFAPGEYRKFLVRLDGSDLKSPLTVTWQLSLAGTALVETSVAFIPVERLPELSAGEGGYWYDGAGRRVIPVLHRRDLTEQRELELGRQLVKAVNTNSRVLVLAEDFAGFERALTVQALLKKRRLDFAPWFAPEDMTPDWAAEMPGMLTRIRNSEAGCVVIVPPSARRRPPGRSDRDWARLTDLLLQSAGTVADRVIIATPLPDPTTERRDGYEAEVRKLMRGADSVLFEYAHLFTEEPAWRDDYRIGEHEWAAVPVNGAQRAAKLLGGIL